MWSVGSRSVDSLVGRSVELLDAPAPLCLVSVSVIELLSVASAQIFPYFLWLFSSWGDHRPRVRYVVRDRLVGLVSELSSIGPLL